MNRTWLIVFAGAILAALAAASAADEKPLRIVLIGDSTVASYPKPPADRPDLTGWGQVFGEFFGEGKAVVLNHAASGRSSKSFLSEGKWTKALADRPDYVFIQFGHNDQPGKGEGRMTDPETTYADNLRRYVKETRAAGAKPVLVTPVARRTFRDGKPADTLAPYAEAMRKVGQETETPVVDLHAGSLAYFAKLGDAGSSDISPAAGDRTHFSRTGALLMARMVAEQIPEKLPDLKGIMKLHR